MSETPETPDQPETEQAEDEKAPPRPEPRVMQPDSTKTGRPAGLQGK